MNYPKEFLDRLNKVTAKRAKTVIQHILKHDFVTSKELKDIYGYNHPPRAVRDVRELGISITTYMILSEDGKKIAAYKFGDPNDSKISNLKSNGRTTFTKALKKSLIEKYGSKCFIYLEELNEKILQVDHRIPYEVAGNQDMNLINNYMLLSPSANRVKSSACENCSNFQEKDIIVCRKCFFAYPEEYQHVAMKYQKIHTIVLEDNEIDDYEKLENIVGREKLAEDIKNHILKYLRELN